MRGSKSVTPLIRMHIFIHRSFKEIPLLEKLCCNWEMLKVGAGNCLVSLAMEILPSFLPFGTSQVGTPTKKNTHKMPADELYEISILFWNSCNNVTKIVYAKDEDSKLIDNYNITADSVIVVIKFLYCWWNSLPKKNDLRA